MGRIVPFFWLVFFVIPATFGSPSDFVNFNTGNGKLEHNTVEAVVRDTFGYLWVGTNYGLNRLDGYQTINFLSDPEDSSSISSNFILSLFVDTENNVWVGTLGGGLNMYDRNTGRFKRFVTTDKPGGIGSLNISEIIEDLNGDLWIGTNGNGVNRFNKKTGVFSHYNMEQYDPEHRKNSNVTKLFRDREGNIWVGMNQSEVFKIDPKTEKITFHGLTRSDNGFRDIGAILGFIQENNGSLLISGRSGNIYRIDSLQPEKMKLAFSEKIFGDNFLTDMAYDRNGNIIVSTWVNGLFIIDSSYTIISHLKRDKNNINSIGSNSINTLYIDQTNTLWIGFTDNGVSMLQLDKKMFTTLDVNSPISNDLNIYSIVRDRKNNLWLGSRGQGLIKYNLINKTYQTYLVGQQKGFVTNSYLSFNVGLDNKIWIGTDGGFLYRYDEIDGSFAHVKNRIDDWSGAVFCIAEDEHFVWCGTWGGGIKKVDKKTLTYESINFDDKDQHRNSVFDIEIHDSYLWIANVGIGLIKYDPVSGAQKVYAHGAEYPCFPEERIIEIYFQNDTTCWLCTDGAGLYRFDPKTEKIESVSENQPLTGNIIQSVVPDSLGNIWIASISGVSSYNPLSNICHTFDKSNGLVNNQLNKSALFLDTTDHIIYTGSVEGVNYFNPYSTRVDSSSQKVIITDFRINGKQVFPDRKHCQKPIDIVDEVHLYPKDRIITIHFSSLEFNPSQKNRYYYRLEGFENEWNETIFSKNFVQYTNLYPGKYHFKVKSANNDGVNSTESTTLTIIVHPAFWQTIWFVLLVLILIASSVVIYIRWRHKSLLLAKIVLERKVAARTAEIQQQKERIEHQNHLLEQANHTKDKFFSIIGHDLRNPVTTIDQLIGLVINRFGEDSNEKTMNYLLFLKKASAGTLELLDDLLMWARTQTNRIEIHKENIPVQELLDSLLNVCMPVAENKNIELLFPDSVDWVIVGDRNTLLTSLRNLVINAIKFSYPPNRVIVSIEEKPDSVIFNIIDSGVGMNEEEIAKLFKIENIHSKQGTSGETGSGLGLVLCKEFLALNGGDIWVKSKPGEGSTFSFSVLKSNDTSN